MMTPIYNRHYITTDDQGRINEQGGYQFRLFLNGDENPSLRAMDGIPLYRWDGEQAVARTEAEIAADRAALPRAAPTSQEQLRADVDFLAAMQGVSL